jgi:hypothetical protein
MTQSIKPFRKRVRELLCSKRLHPTRDLFSHFRASPFSRCCPFQHSLQTSHHVTSIFPIRRDRYLNVLFGFRSPVSDKSKTTTQGTAKNVLPSFDPREPDKAELYVHDLLTPVPSQEAMRHKAETHRPSTISNVIKMPEIKGQQVAIRFEDVHPPYRKTQLVDFLADEMGKKMCGKEGDTADVVIDVEPQK